jgi:hypothetical protein
LRIDITYPRIPDGTIRRPEHRRITANAPCGGIGAAIADAGRADTRAMSGEGRCARAERGEIA